MFCPTTKGNGVSIPLSPESVDKPVFKRSNCGIRKGGDAAAHKTGTVPSSALHNAPMNKFEVIDGSLGLPADLDYWLEEVDIRDAIPHFMMLSRRLRPAANSALRPAPAGPDPAPSIDDDQGPQPEP